MTMTTEQLEILHAGNRIIGKLSAAIDGEQPRPTMFALSAFVVSICLQAEVTQEQFADALRKSWEIAAPMPPPPRWRK